MIDYQKEINNLSDLNALALTIYGEARGESIEGQIAVGNVIRNRVISEHKNYKAICLASKQFSCWNTDDPNYIILGEAAAKLNIDIVPQIDSMFNQILWIAVGLIKNQIKDNVKGAKNYMSLTLFHSYERPNWASNPKSSLPIDNHIFLTV